MSAPAVDRAVELDARTRDELQPPCDWYDPPCDRPAAWITRISRACGHGPNAVLLCDGHRHEIASLLGCLLCTGCWPSRTRVDVVFEPLTPPASGG